MAWVPQANFLVENAGTLGHNRDPLYWIYFSDLSHGVVPQVSKKVA
jgi:hypothetical protein